MKDFKQPIDNHAEPFPRINFVIYGFLFATLAAAFVLPATKILSDWANVGPNITISSKAWKILTSQNTNPTQAKAEIFTKGSTRIDPIEQPERYILSSHFWLGTEIAPSILNVARETGANQLVLGWIYGNYQLWIDGELMQTGSRSDTQPIVISILPKRLKIPRPLSVVFYIENEELHHRPDNLNYLFGEHIGEGFYKYETAENYRRMTAFAKYVRPVILFGLNLLFSLLFFFVWLPQKLKQEYFFLSCYTLVSAAVQLFNIDLIYSALTVDTLYRTNDMLLILEGGFGFLLGVSLSRSSKQIFRHVSWAIFSLCLILSLVPISHQLLFVFGKYLNKYMVPTLYFAGAAICFYQLRVIHSKGINASKARKLQLFTFGSLLFCLAAISIGQAIAWHSLSFIQNVLLYRFAHFSIIFMLGAIVLQDFKKQQLLIEKMPLSSYHRRPNLPESVHGFIFMIDLKNSERLFRSGSANGDAGKTVDDCLSLIWDIVDTNGGSVLFSEGDSLCAFFDRNHCVNPLITALETAGTAAQALKGRNISFRASIADGAIKPIWREFSGINYPAWIETGTNNVFVEAARLMDLERSVTAGEAENTRIMLTESSWQTIKHTKNLHQWQVHTTELIGKHDVKYNVAALELRTNVISLHRDQNQTEKKSAA